MGRGARSSPRFVALPHDIEGVHIPEFARDLEDAGYHFVGFMRFSHRGVIVEFAVQRSPDALAFVFPRTMFDRPQLSIRSLLENGSIVDTRTRPATRLEHVWLLRPWQHQPLVGYHLETHPAGTDPAELQRRHGERLREMCEREHTRVRPHLDIPLALALQNRLEHVRSVRTKAGIGFGLAINVGLTAWGALGNLPLLWLLSLVLLPLNLSHLGPGLALLLPLPRRVRSETLAGPAPPVALDEQVH